MSTAQRQPYCCSAQSLWASCRRCRTSIIGILRYAPSTDSWPPTARRGSAQRVTNRQVLESADERCRRQFGLARQFDGLQAGHQLGEEAVHLHPRQRCSQAEMHTVAEGQVLVRVAADVEPEGLVEDILVAI